VRRAAEKVPNMRKALDRLKEADRALQKIGDAVALVIETTDELEEQKDRCESFRRQAEAAGISLRYDLPTANDDATSDTAPDSDADSEI
jgi:DNA repair exonuclease SbcCD ATPase subunit